jgi:hypothetical protein
VRASRRPERRTRTAFRAFGFTGLGFTGLGFTGLGFTGLGLPVFALAVASLVATGAAPALAASPSATFTLTGALHARGTSRCSVSSFQGDQSVDFFNATLTIKVNAYKSAGPVNLAKTHDDFASVDEIVGGKSSMWVAGWSGASDTGVPATVGPHRAGPRVEGPDASERG